MPNFRGTYFYGDYCSGVREDDSHVRRLGVEPSGRHGPGRSGGTLQFQFFELRRRCPGRDLHRGAQRPTAEVGPTVPRLRSLGCGGGGCAWTRPATGRGRTCSLRPNVPASFYRVYRGSVNGAYSCVFKATTPKWTLGGDATNPAGGQLFAYVVSAVNGAGVETMKGTTGTFNAVTCGNVTSPNFPVGHAVGSYRKGLA